jgi:pimeloyl-ACP methyl ester carboxylesterase
MTPVKTSQSAPGIGNPQFPAGNARRRGASRHLFILSTFLLSGFLAGCATSLPGTVTETVRERRVEYALQGQGTPIVVFENGLGAKLYGWSKVYPDISQNATAFAYNRPGYGDSELTRTPRDGEHVVEELRTLLQTKGLKPPYVLVGHSLGGLYMQYFARRYPQEVAGVVLVDSTHPAQFQGEGAPEKWPGLARTGFNLLLSGTEKEEFDRADATGTKIMALPPFTGKPVVVLSALQPLAEKGALANDANDKRQDIARLFPGSRQVWVDSGHWIQWEKPEAVITAIREVMVGGKLPVKP